MKKLISLLAISLILPMQFVSADSIVIPPQPSGGGGGGGSQKSEPWQRKLKELHYDGIPLGEVAKLLGSQFPEINFVVAPDDKDAQVNVDLRSVTLEDIFAAMNLASKGIIQADKINDRMVHFKLVESPPPQPA